MGTPYIIYDWDLLKPLYECTTILVHCKSNAFLAIRQTTCMFFWFFNTVFSNNNHNNLPCFTPLSQCINHPGQTLEKAKNNERKPMRIKKLQVIIFPDTWEGNSELGVTSFRGRRNNHPASSEKSFSGSGIIRSKVRE